MGNKADSERKDKRWRRVKSARTKPIWKSPLSICLQGVNVNSFEFVDTEQSQFSVFEGGTSSRSLMTRVHQVPPEWLRAARSRVASEKNRNQ